MIWNKLVPLKPFGLFLEGKMWHGGFYDFAIGTTPRYLAEVSDPSQVGPNRGDPEHYDEFGRYLWWGC